MTATAQPAAATVSPPALQPWTRVLAWAVGITVATDVVFMALIRTVIPPPAVVAVLTVGALVLLRRRPRAGIVVVGLLSLLWAIGSAPFALPHLTHPESGIDFVHAVIETPGRLVAFVAAIGAWRRASAHSARRFASGGVVALVLLVLFAAGASIASTGDAAEAGDLAIAVEEAAFPSEVRVASGWTLHITNDDIVRHTFTVEGTAIDAELPARQGVRVPVELETGTYTVVCAVPGHEFMQAELVVE